MKGNYKITLALILLLALTSICSAGQDEATLAGTNQKLGIVTGQTVFIPAYSEIYFLKKRSFNLNVTIGIHNTDTDTGITILSVREYNTDGKQVKEHIEKPMQLGPIGSTVFLNQGAEKGEGVGANFIVEWSAEKPVTAPIIEAVMVGSAGSYGISLISPGRIIKEVK